MMEEKEHSIASGTDGQEKEIKEFEWKSLQLSKFYKKIKTLGRGATGKIYSATDLTTRKVVVIKRVKSTEKRFAEKEVKILTKLDNPLIIKLLNHFTDRDRFYLVLEKMDIDLHKVLHSQSSKFTHEHHKFFLKQVLEGLRYLHNNSVVHRDIKPANLLVNSYCCLKFCDFAYSAEGIRGLTEREMQTTWYRAPEIVMGSPTYTSAIDMWSVGCVFAEILNSRIGLGGRTTTDALLSSRDDEDQLRVIIKRFGKPTEETLPGVSKLYAYPWVQKLPDEEKLTWGSFFKVEVHPMALDLLSKFLVYDPEKRITASEALNHPYFKLP